MDKYVLVISISFQALALRLAQPPSPICPYNFFSLNHSGFLGCMANIFTYMIVLMQFKQSSEAAGDTQTAQIMPSAEV